jgi:hypothetical protein
MTRARRRLTHHMRRRLLPAGASVGVRLAALAFLVVASATAAFAHDRTTSYSSWDIRGRQAHVTVRLSELDISRFPWAARAGGDPDRMLGGYLAQRLQLRAGDRPCPIIEPPRSLRAAAGRLLYEWRLACPDAGALHIRSELFLDVAPAHLHFARLQRNGTAPLERVLSDGERTWDLVDTAPTHTAEPSGTSLLGYVGLGINHILSGYDHLAFLLALLLIGGTLGEVAKVVTGFTVAHSITLGLTVLGYVRPDTAPVEALIGLSIALVATENVWLIGTRTRAIPRLLPAGLALLALVAAAGYGRVPALTFAGLSLFSACYFELLARTSRAASLRWAIAFIFGLVHGFGFAAVLGEAGLPANRVAHALFGFNLGVELGQLAAVALVWPLLRLATGGNRRRLNFTIVEVGSAADLALGIFWFVSRTYG